MPEAGSAQNAGQSLLGRHLLALGGALLAVLAGLGLHLLLGPLLSYQRPLLYFMVGVAASSYCWGLWGGLYATFFSVLLLTLLPGGAPLTWPSLVAFGVLSGALVALVARTRWLNGRLRQTVGALQAANAELSEMQAQLSDAAYSDPLTRLGNRRAFDDDLDSACASALAGEEAPFSVALIDLDGLKQVNDIEGHPRGDALLRAFAQSLQSAVPAEARVYRFGGDEFAIIWPHLSGSGAAPQVNAAVSRAVVLTRDLGFLRAGASVGTCCVPDEAGSARDALALSDLRLYEHKRAGKDARPRWAQNARTG